MIIKANAVSKGMAMGRVYVYEHFAASFEKKARADKDAELERYKKAKISAAKEIDEIITSLGGNDGSAKIFSAHKVILFDEEIDQAVYNEIEDGASVEYAVQVAYDSFISLISKVKNPIIASRTADICDVKNRLIRVSSGKKEKRASKLEAPVILVASELLPSDAATLDRKNVLGIVCETGGETSHAVIIARGCGIPAVLGARGICAAVRDGDEIILDAVDGVVITAPDDKTKEEYKQKEITYKTSLSDETKYLSKQAFLLSGERIYTGVNVGSDANENDLQNCDFLGLLRTELTFMNTDRLPSEEEQFLAYKQVVLNAKGKTVTLRTLDVGGDKALNYMPLAKEDNPFLGRRGIRLCLKQTDVFTTQLAAALRASAFGPLQIMFPMVGSVEEFLKAKKLVETAKKELDARGIQYDKQIKLGVMIEVPSLALVADLIAKKADFGSIGTNDLCQYLFAADRTNADVCDCYKPLSTAMLRIISFIVSAFDKENKEISICGELASDEKAAKLLVGLGLRHFSVPPSCLASIKRTFCGIDLFEAQKSAEKGKEQ